MQRVLVLFRVVVGLERGRRRAQHDHRVRHLGPHHRYIAGVVARSFFLFVGGILFLVDDDKSQVADRSEDRRTRADHHARISAFDAMPLLGALLIRQRRMEDGHFIAKHLVQIGGNRRREPDLGNQQDRGAAWLKYRSHRGEIDRRLARPGYAMQQDPAELARCSCLPESLQRVLLGGVEFESEWDRRALTRDTWNSAGSSMMSTRPRLTRELSVLRGMSSELSESTSARPLAWV